MRARSGILTPLGIAAVAALTMTASDPAIAQAPQPPMGIKLPAFEAPESDDKADNLSVAVSATDAAGRGPGEQGFSGASRNGECRVLLDDVEPVSPEQLYDSAFVHLDGVVQAAGGIEAIVENPEMIPAVHIWSDVNAPWRCVAGAIYATWMAGYPTAGFISAPAGTDGTPVATRAAYIGLPIPVVPGSSRETEPPTNRIELTARNEILWNGQAVSAAALLANIEQALILTPQTGLEFEPEAEVGYDFAASVLNVISGSQVVVLSFAGIEKYSPLDEQIAEAGAR